MVDPGRAVVLDYCAAVRGILNDDQGGPLHPPSLRMAEALNEVRESLQRDLDEKKGGSRKPIQPIGRMHHERPGRSRGAARANPSYVESRRWLRPSNPGPKIARTQEKFEELIDQFEQTEDPIRHHMATVMISFLAGLFVGEDEYEEIKDNLDLERWFRLPKSHERRIHGRRHAGIRLVLAGPTLVHALDAHAAHPGPFTVADLFRIGRPESRRAKLSAESPQDHEEGTIRRNGRHSLRTWSVIPESPSS